MKRYIPAAVLLLGIIVGICSCESNGHKAKLDKAESIMTDKPDSALTILESISKSNLKSPKLKAKYSLLYATALDKNYIDTTDLGVLADADRYYSRFGSPEEKMKTNYYKGVIYHNQKNDIQALYHYQKA